MTCHIYNVTSDGNLCFYEEKDFVLFFSLIASYASKYKVRILFVCLMRNHYHMFVDADSQTAISLFVNVIQSRYSREFNKYHSFKISFKKAFGHAKKTSLKSIKTCLIYIANNPVEKKVSEDVMQYRWNFIRYREESNPCSEPQSIRNSSREFLSISSIVRKYAQNGQALTYAWLDSIAEVLSPEDFARLLDYIVRIYNPIEYEYVDKVFSGYTNFINACLNYSGSEYDIAEEYVVEDYKHYDSLMTVSREHGALDKKGRVCLQALQDDDIAFRDFFKTILNCRVATELEIVRFFHIKRR